MKKLALFLSFLFVISCTKDPIIYTLTTSANPSEGGTVSPVVKVYNEGETATITATPAVEYVFQSWSGATGSASSTSLVMNSDKSVTANFVKKKYALTTSVEGEGTVSEKVIKAGVATDYNSGTIVELTAEPSAEWVFKEWTGDITGTENPTQITIDKAKSVTAVFVKKQYKLSVFVRGEGTVTEKIIKSGLATDYNSGTIIELTAVPEDGWEFEDWYIHNDIRETDNPLEITINKEKLITANFVNQDLKDNLQERLNSGQETPIEIYNSDNSLLGGLYGLFYQGGLISYLDTNNGVGFVVETKNDSSEKYSWGCEGTFISKASETAIFTGINNTLEIINSECSSSNDLITAVKYCYNLSLNGYDDWYLPSKDELDMVFNNVHLNLYGNFENSWYWSSSDGESNGDAAWVQSFKNDYNGLQATYDVGIKHFKNEVRAIRYFGTGYNLSGHGVSNIKQTSAQLYTQVLGDCGRDDLIEKGFWVSENETPNKLNSQIFIDNNISKCNVVDVTADNLNSNTTYYYLVYAINKFGTYTSEIKSFTTLE